MIQGALLNGLKERVLQGPVAVVEISHGSGYLQDSVIGSGNQSHLAYATSPESFAGRVKPAVPFDLSGLHESVGVQVIFGVTGNLVLSGGWRLKAQPALSSACSRSAPQAPRDADRWDPGLVLN